MNTELESVVAAAKAGGAIVKEYFGQILRTEQKTHAGDLRTKADIESEQAIIKVLEAAFPQHNIYAEEGGGVDHKAAYTFVVDPLDGTNNFVLGIPYSAVSIGLLHQDEVILGVIYNPILDRCYTAQKGKGAYLNGKPIHVSKENRISQATISYTCGYNTDRNYSEAITSRLHDHSVKRIINMWAPAYDYCLLASGAIEAVISKEGDLEDYAAAKLIVSEAGGMVTTFDNTAAGAREPNFIASNGSHIHDLILSLV